MVSLIILTYNRLDVTKDCLESIRRHTPEPHEIIIIDNGSSDGSREWLRQRATEQSTIRLIENQENRGFSAGCNQGMQAAKGDYLLLINNDTVVTPGWLSGLLEPFKDPRTGIVGPLTSISSGIQEWPWLEYQNLAELDDFAIRLRQQQRYWWIKCRRIVGFCMLFRRSLMEQIGLLDERFGSGNYEDDDYCLRAALAGYQNLALGDVFIHHVGQATFSGNQLDYRAAMLRNRNLFTEKWSSPPADEQQAARIIRFKVLEAAQELLDKGNGNAAVELLLKDGIARLSGETDFYLLMARIFLDVQLPKDAMDVLKEAPEGREVSLLKIRCLLELGQLEEALSVLEELSGTKQAEQPELATLRGLLLEKLGQSVDASQQYSQAVSEQPNNQLALAGLTRCHLQHGNQAEALLLLQRSIACGYGTAALAVWHGLLKSGQELHQATEFLARMQHCYPNLQLLSNLRIDLLLRQGDDLAAMTEIEQLMATATLSDGLLAAALEVRSRLGIRKPDPKRLQQGITVTLAMMVKDEEDNLPRCLASVTPLVDEIVIVDTGSSDRTVQIATAYGAKVLHQPWPGDYSVPRNLGIDAASCNWILSLDADEVISERDHDLFLHLIQASAGQIVAYHAIARDYTNQISLEGWQPNQGEYPAEETGRGWVHSSRVRIFPNMPGVRFENPIHEMVGPWLRRAGVRILPADFVIHHYGYLDNERQQRKLEHYYQLCEKKYIESNASPDALIELGVQAAFTGRYERAITVLQQLLEKQPDSYQGWFNLGYACLKHGDFRQGSQAGRKAMELKENYRESAVNAILCELALGRLQDARQLLDEFLPNNSNYPMLQLCQAVLLALEGDKTAAKAEFDRLEAQQIDVDGFVAEVAGYLQQGGQQRLMDKLSG